MNAMESVSDLSLVGHVVTSTEDFPRGEVRVKDGRIHSVSGTVSDKPFKHREDVGEKLILPGIIDPHVHCLSYEGEGIEIGTRSAAAGGVTTILEMPFDAGGPIWTVKAFEDKRAMAEKESHVDIALYATIKPGGEGMKEISGLAQAGACCFKVSTFHTDTERFPRTPDNELLKVFERIARTNLRVCVHSENDEIVQSLVVELKPKGELDPRMHCAARPPVTETAAVANILELGREIGVKLHFCHISTPRAVDLVDWYSAEGSPVTVETCPHYLTLTEDDMLERGPMLKCNPPLRTISEVDGLWDRLREGKIDAIASDHAPWPRSYKEKSNIFDNASGGPGVETLFAVTASEALHHRDIDPRELVRSTSTRVARAFGLDDRKGDLRVGLDADIVVFDQKREWILDAVDLHSTAGWSAFQGRALKGKVERTYSRGELIWDGSEVLSVAGRGRFLKPNYRD